MDSAAQAPHPAWEQACHLGKEAVGPAVAVADRTGVCDLARTKDALAAGRRRSTVWTNTNGTS